MMTTKLSKDEFTTAVRETLSGDLREHDINRWSDADGDHVDIVLTTEDGFDALVNDDGTESVPMACIGWCDAWDSVAVFSGEGGLDSYDVTTHVDEFDNVTDAIDAAADILGDDEIESTLVFDTDERFSTDPALELVAEGVLERGSVVVELEYLINTELDELRVMTYYSRDGTLVDESTPGNQTWAVDDGVVTHSGESVEEFIRSHFDSDPEWEMEIAEERVNE